VSSVVVSATLLGGATALAQEPQPEATPTRPDGPPPEAINCVRPDTTKPQSQLNSEGSLSVALDASTHNIVISVLRVPAEATCYAVYRQPSGSNPVLFQYGAAPVGAPKDQPDPLKPSVAGTYCYTLIFGSPNGSSAPYERCVDLPPSVAPTATPVPDFLRPPAPVTGPPATGNSAPPDRVVYSIAPLGIALAGLLLAAFGAYGLRQKRLNRR
jgi:hypothetical protein